MVNKPQYFKNGITISNKQFGVAVYGLYRKTKRVDGLFRKTKYIDAGELGWEHICNHWYKNKKSQLMGLHDLSYVYGVRYKLVPIKNDFKTIPERILNIDKTCTYLGLR